VNQQDQNTIDFDNLTDLEVREYVKILLYSTQSLVGAVNEIGMFVHGSEWEALSLDQFIKAKTVEQNMVQAQADVDACSRTAKKIDVLVQGKYETMKK